MLRFNASKPSETGVQVTVQGWITWQTESLLRQECLAILEEGWPLQLDLAGVTFVDSEGASMLRHLQKRGATIGPCPPVIREFVEKRGPGTRPS